MATQLNLTDKLSTLRTNFNGLVVEFNNVASISSVTTDAGIISVGSGQTNRNININGGSNIQTNVNGASIEVNIVTNPVFAGLSATGTVSFTGAFSTSSATIGTLTVGTSAPTQYTFPTAVGAQGQALVVNASGDLEFGLGGTGVTSFKGLTDTPSDYSTLGGRVLIFDGSPSGVANNVTSDSTFTFDTTNDFLQLSKIRIGNNISPTDTTPINIRKTDPAATSEDTIVSVYAEYSNDTVIESPNVRAFTIGLTFLDDIGSAVTDAIGIESNAATFFNVQNFYGMKTTATVNVDTTTIAISGCDVTANVLFGGITTTQCGSSISLNSSGTISDYAAALDLSSVFDNSCTVDKSFALRYVCNPGTSNPSNTINDLNGIDLNFGDVNLDGTQVSTMCGMKLSSVGGSFTNATSVSNSYAILSLLPLQSVFSGPIRVNLSGVGDAAQPITLSGITTRNPISGSDIESLEIVVNGAIRYIPLYSAVT